MGKLNAGVMEVVAWGCWLLAVMFEAQLCKCELISTSAPVTPIATVDNHSAFNPPNIINIKFSTKDVTRQSYTTFMLVLFQALTQDADRSGSIPILPQLSETDSRSYVHVEISNDQSQTITFAIHITNVYVVGYQKNANSVAYFFNSYRDMSVQEAAFPNAVRRELLSFNGDYGSLGDRSSVPLGFRELNNAITNLHYEQPSGSGDASVRRGLLIVIQMVSEAARFNNLQQLLLNTIPGGSYTPDGLMQAYQNNWGKISCAVQNAYPNGTFRTPVTLTQQVVLVNVSQVRVVVSILLFCRSLGRQADVVFSTPFIQPSLNSDRVLQVGGDNNIVQVLEPY